MAIIEKTILSVKNMLKQTLDIPEYQRPYKWQAKHANQLLDDIIRHKNKSSYRLGTVVLHKDETSLSESPLNSPLNIVDGQQRLLTLTLLCHFLNTKTLFQPSLLKLKFDSTITRENLQHNAAVLQSRLKQLSETDREELVSFLLNKCQLISVTLDDLSEALY